jgi:hypothetical protein
MWYAAVFAGFGVVWWLLSALPREPGSDPTSPLTGQGSFLSGPEMLHRVGNSAVTWTAALLQMVAALLLVIPLAFVYVRTRTRLKYDHTLVQTVIVLPISITAVLMMVRDSLALAFGLAGVVAAIRFRSNLKESGDSVYIFTAVVIGFAAGIQSLGIAAVLSLLFSVLELSIWYWDIADVSGHQIRRIGLGEVTEVHDAPVPVPEPNGRDQILRLEVADLDRAHAGVTTVLDQSAKRWKLLKREAGASPAGALEYAVRLRRSVDLQQLASRVRQGASGTIHSLDWRPQPENLDGGQRPDQPKR